MRSLSLRSRVRIRRRLSIARELKLQLFNLNSNRTLVGLKSKIEGLSYERLRSAKHKHSKRRMAIWRGDMDQTKEKRRRRTEGKQINAPKEQTMNGAGQQRNQAARAMMTRVCRHCTHVVDAAGTATGAGFTTTPARAATSTPGPAPAPAPAPAFFLTSSDSC